LSGLKPDEDIKIEFTGMRPGEKLYEELSTMLENTAPTGHEKIRIFRRQRHAGWAICWRGSIRLREICESRDVGRLVVALKEIVLDYSPSTHLLKRVIEPATPSLRSRRWLKSARFSSSSDVLNEIPIGRREPARTS
jgi:FlaA1/EpsC-like NDP-sugar epimerase